MKEICYSLNGEEFYDIDYINDIIEDDTESIFVGDIVKIEHSKFVNRLDITDYLANIVYDNTEYGDVYISALEEKGKNHSQNINALIVEYLNKNVEQPTFYDVENIKEISINEFKRMYKKIYKEVQV